MDNMRDSFGLSEKKKVVKRKRKYSTRDKYLKGVYIYLTIIIAVLTMAFVTNKRGGDVDTSDLDSNKVVVGNSTMNRVDTKWDPQQQLLITQYFIGDKKDVDAVDDDSKLANLNYKTYTAVPETAKVEPKTTTIRVNDHFIVVVSKKVREGFDVLQYQMKPIPIDKSLGTSEANVSNFIIHESALTKLRYKNLRVETKEGYQTIYYRFLIKSYKNSIQKAKSRKSKAESRIKGNEALIGKLKNKMLDASDADATDLQNQIDDTKDSINSDKAIVSTQTEQINHFEKRIAWVKSQMVY